MSIINELHTCQVCGNPDLTVNPKLRKEDKAICKRCRAHTNDVGHH